MIMVGDESGFEKMGLKSVLHSTGKRWTKQREAVLATMQGLCTHPTAEEVFVSVRQDVPNISLATVYKALDSLVDIGLIGRLNTSRGPARYDGNPSPHVHVRCTETGAVKDLPPALSDQVLASLDPQVVEEVGREMDVDIQGFLVEFYGNFNGPSQTDT
jgi:Fe2+ or Zn2+ uptake regulation protein